MITVDSDKILEEELGHSRRFIEDLRKLQKFLLSMTAKDVSILITFRKIKNPDDETGNQTGLPTIILPVGNHPMLRIMISVIDLDPKPVHRIPTWIEKRQDWLKSYLKN